MLCGSYITPPRDKTACQTCPRDCNICISSVESDVYDKKKIQMFGVNMTFISSSEVKKMYISWVPKWIWLLFHRVKWKKCIFHECLPSDFTRWNKSHTMTFISSSEVKKMYISWVPAFGTHEIYIFSSLDEIKVIFTPNIWIRHSWNIHFFHFTRWNKSHIHSKHLNILYIWQLSYHTPCQSEGHGAYMVQGLIWGMIWKLPYHNLFLIHFSFWQICLFDTICGVKGKTAECSECGDMGFLPEEYIYYFFFCPGKKAISPTWPGDMFFFCFFFFFFCLCKKPYHPRDNYHTFSVPQEWYVLESHACITYSNWTYFLVNVW